MVSFTRAISQLCKNNLISLENGSVASTNRDEFLLHMRGMESGIETFRGDLGESSDESVVNMKRLLHSAVANKGSDLLLTVGSRPCVRFDGNLVPLAVDPLTSIDTKRLLFSILTPKQRAIFEEIREIDIALSVGIKRSNEPDSEAVPRRFRVNGFFQRGNVAIAIRIIQATVPPADTLGLPLHLLSLADKNQGLVLVTGPTGSGKTTTLYAALNRIYTHEKKIITIEDPVEYQLDGINQMPVNRKRGLNFAGALRVIVRQDPDVIMVGEIRDRETADIAIRSALTGHLVFSTLHTNDAPGAVTRLLDMGVEPYLLASSLEGVLAQRLVRTICPHCREPHRPDGEVIRRIGHRPANGAKGTFFHGRGCRECRQTGYIGRVGIFELLRFTPAVREATTRHTTAAEIATAAPEDHEPMRKDGFRKAASGITTLEEILRVTQDTQSEQALS